MSARVLVSISGGLLLAVGCGWAWALYYPSDTSSNILFGGMLIPPTWVGFVLWLWFCGWRQRWLRLSVPAVLLWGAVAWNFYHG